MPTGAELVTCICGSGNNGGDGIALACILKDKHIPVRIVLAGNQNKMTEDSAFFLDLARSIEVPVSSVWNPVDEEILVDALFGVGLNRMVEGKYAALIRDMNGSGKKILSADIPSGLNALTGEILGVSVCAEETVTMQYLKAGLFLGQGPAKTGRLTVCSLDEDSPFTYDVDLYWQEESDVRILLGPRPFDSHKGKNGLIAAFFVNNKICSIIIVCSILYNKLIIKE